MEIVILDDFGMSWYELVCHGMPVSPRCFNPTESSAKMRSLSGLASSALAAQKRSGRSKAVLGYDSGRMHRYERYWIHSMILVLLIKRKL